MIRVSKLADYGTLLMVYIAQHVKEIHNAKDVAMHTNIRLPTVSKLLKLLAKYGLLISERGSKGGYRLAKDAKNISIADIVTAIDGNLGMTDCSQNHGTCSLESVCTVRVNWRLISHTITKALECISLEDMAKPHLARRLDIKIQPKIKISPNRVNT